METTRTSGTETQGQVRVNQLFNQGGRPSIARKRNRPSAERSYFIFEFQATTTTTVKRKKKKRGIRKKIK